MNFNELIPIIKAVLINPYVIGATVAIIIYCNFMSYVARYKKKPSKPKKSKEQVTPAAPKQEASETSPDKEETSDA